MSDKAEKRRARAVVGAYYESQLAGLVARVGDAIDRHRAGELDAFEVDRVMFQYSRAAKALWVFCHRTSPTMAAAMIGREPPEDWWGRGAPRER